MYEAGPARSFPTRGVSRPLLIRYLVKSYDPNIEQHGLTGVDNWPYPTDPLAHPRGAHPRGAHCMNHHTKNTLSTKTTLFVSFSFLSFCFPRLVSVLGGIVLGGYHQTSPLARPRKHRLHDIDELLLVVHGPVDFVIVARAEVDHDVLVAKEKHHRAWVVQLVHSVEVGHLQRGGRGARGEGSDAWWSQG